MMKLFQSVHRAKYFYDNIECKTYTKHDIITYNFYIWTVAFFLGLQFSHLKQIPGMDKFVIDW